MKNKYVTLRLLNGETIVIRKRHVKFVIFEDHNGIKNTNEIQTKTKFIDGKQLTNQGNVTDALYNYFHKKLLLAN